MDGRLIIKELYLPDYFITEAGYEQLSKTTDPASISKETIKELRRFIGKRDCSTLSDNAISNLRRIYLSGRKTDFCSPEDADLAVDMGIHLANGGEVMGHLDLRKLFETESDLHSFDKS